MEWPTLMAITCCLNITSASSLLGKWCCSTTTSFHFVPTLERTSREGAPPGKSSPFVRQRGKLCGYFIVILTLSANSKALTSRFRDQAVFFPSCRNRCFNGAALSLHNEALECGKSRLLLQELHQAPRESPNDQRIFTTESRCQFPNSNAHQS